MKQRRLVEEDTTAFKLSSPPNAPSSQLTATPWASLGSWGTEHGTGREKTLHAFTALVNFPPSTTQALTAAAPSPHSESKKSQPHITNCHNNRGLYDTAARKVEEEQAHGAINKETQVERGLAQGHKNKAAPSTQSVLCRQHSEMGMSHMDCTYLT